MQLTEEQWEHVQGDYRAGILSNRAIADKYGVSEGAIRKKIKSHGWTKDLKSAVKHAASRKVAEQTANIVRDSRSTQKSGTQYAVSTKKGTHKHHKLTDDEVVETNAQLVASVQMSHRKDINASRNIANILFAELQSTTENLDDIENAIIDATSGDKNILRRNAMLKAVSLPSRASTMRDLSTALKNLVTIEREAYGMNEILPTKPNAELTNEQLDNRLTYLLGKVGVAGTD
jgi:uncharacterized protein YjcR